MQPWMARVNPGAVPLSSGVQAPAQVTPNGDEGHFQWKDGSRFDKSGQYPGGRYIAKKIIGSGTYGKVVECVDQKHGVQTAIRNTSFQRSCDERNSNFERTRRAMRNC